MSDPVTLNRPRQRPQRPLGVTDPRQPTAKRQGLGRLQIAAAIAAQSGRCAAGGEPLGSEYGVDHCHVCARLHGHTVTTGCARCYRGIVCARHNSALAGFGDAAAGLRRALEYLEAHEGHH
jgi:Recombination endonuclease VII